MGIVLRVTSGPHTGQEYSVDRRETFTVGRSSRVHFPMVYDQALSREHFQIDNEPPLCHLVDLGSTNGTKVNGLRVGRVLLREGDVITAGDSAFLVQFIEDSAGRAQLRHLRGLWRADPDRVEPVAVRRSRSSLSRTRRTSGCATTVRPPAQVSQNASRLPDRGMDRRRGHGRGLSRPAALAQPAGRHQDDQRQQRGRRQGQRLFSPRNRGPARPLDAQRPVPSQHRRLLRDLRDRFAVSTGHGVRRRQERAGLDQGAGTAAADRQRRPDRPSPAVGARIRSFEGIRAPRRQAVQPAGDGPGPPAPGQADRFRTGQELRRDRAACTP